MTTDADGDQTITHWTSLPTLWVVTDAAAAETLRARGEQVHLVPPGAWTGWQALHEAQGLAVRVLVVALPRTRAGNEIAEHLTSCAPMAGVWVVVHAMPDADLGAKREGLVVVPDPESARRLRAAGVRVHCTAGVLDPIAGIGPDRLALDLQLNGAERVELIFPSTLQGDATATYLTRRLLEHEALEIVRLVGVIVG